MDRRRSRWMAVLSSFALVLTSSFPGTPGAASASAARRKLLERRADAPLGAAGLRTFSLYDGSTARIGLDGFVSVTSPAGGVRPVFIQRPGVGSALGDTWGPGDRELLRRLSLPQRGMSSPNEVIVVLSGAGSSTTSR